MNCVIGPEESKGNFVNPSDLASLTYSTWLCLNPTQTDRPLIYGLNSLCSKMLVRAFF